MNTLTNPENPAIMSSMNAFDVVDAILDGEFDAADLEKIKGAIEDRREQMALMQASRVRSQIGVGTQVRVVGQLRPRYLIGLTGTVRKVNQKTLTMDFDDTVAARRYSHGVRMPMEHVEVVV